MYYTYAMKKYWAAFGAVPNMKSEHWQKLLGYFPNLEKAWEAKTGDLLSAGLNEKWIDVFLDFKNKIGPDEIFDNLNKEEVSFVTIMDEDYPKNLKEIYHPPYILYTRGEMLKDDEYAIAIVGSRKGTDYGKRATYEIAKELAQSGITVVSGLALGLDTEAHTGALAGGGRTLAVLANGLETIYPTTNTQLGKQILNCGCIISEQPLGTPALRQNFPARNRIISGLSLGVMVSEAGEGSGTLHTISFALEQNRQIYAVPGAIYNPLSKGPNNLIKNGAKPITSAQDILEDFGIIKTVNEVLPEGPEEEIIFEIIKDENLHINEITKKSDLSAQEIARILTLMEINGKVKNLGGMVYSLN